MAKKAAYTEESISQLKGADRVRKRPAVIFGSAGIDGCQHAVLRVFFGPQRLGSLLHAVCLGIYGSGNPQKRYALCDAL